MIYGGVVWNVVKAIGTAVFVLVCLWVGWDEVVIRVTGERTTGTVVAVDDTGSTEHAWWEFPVTRPDGLRTTVVAREYIWIFVPDVGSKGTVIYDPADPQNRAVFGSFPSPMETLTVLFTLGSILIVWSMIPRRKRRPATEPAATEPAATEPAATEPAATEPPAGGPPVELGAESAVHRARARSEDQRRDAQRRAGRQRSAQRRALRKKN